MDGNAGLKILCGGEALPRDAGRPTPRLGGELWNMYGPTETTIWSTFDGCRRVEGQRGIGRPIANTQVYIWIARSSRCRSATPGELYIGGDGLARGYLERPDLTAERFVKDPFSSVPGARLYRTGDLARWRGDGTVQCLGRADHQVKIRGYRIEPGEIEALLAKHPDIDQAVVVARADSSGEQRLVGYLIAREGVTLDPAELRRFLAQGLPEYMVPSTFVALKTFPLTPNGKIDRRRLPAPDVRRADVSPVEPPRTVSEATLHGIWRERVGARIGRGRRQLL